MEDTKIDEQSQIQKQAVKIQSMLVLKRCRDRPLPMLDTQREKIFILYYLILIDHT